MDLNTKKILSRGSHCKHYSPLSVVMRKNFKYIFMGLQGEGKRLRMSMEWFCVKEREGNVMLLL